MSSTTNLSAWALSLAEQGWRVFPLVPGTKRPAVRDWEHRASTDPSRITRCWHGGSSPWNIGLATGPSGLVVLDLDTTPTDTTGPDGAQALAGLATARGVDLPATYTVTTPSGGTHLYYQCPPGVRLRNTAAHLAPRIDTRAGGGYVVAPGSVLPAGGYELADDTDPPDLPAWLVQALSERPAAALSTPAQIACTDPSGYTTAALRGECARIRHAPPGQHNAVLSRAAYALGQLVGAGLLTEQAARAELTSAAGFLLGADCDCTPREVDRVITAGLTAGTRNPRRSTGRTRPARSAA